MKNRVAYKKYVPFYVIRDDINTVPAPLATFPIRARKFYSSSALRLCNTLGVDSTSSLYIILYGRFEIFLLCVYVTDVSAFSKGIFIKREISLPEIGWNRLKREGGFMDSKYFRDTLVHKMFYSWTSTYARG